MRNWRRKRAQPATRAPSPFAEEGGAIARRETGVLQNALSGRMRGRFRLVAAAVSLAPLSAPTHHPPRFARRLLPQGEKGFPPRPPRTICGIARPWVKPPFAQVRTREFRHHAIERPSRSRRRG